MWVLASLAFWCSWQMVSLENFTGTGPNWYFGMCLWCPTLGRRGGSSVWHIFNVPRTQKSGRSSATFSAPCQLQQNPWETSLSLIWGTSSPHRKNGIISSVQKEQENLWTRFLCSLDFFPILQNFSMAGKWFCGLCWSTQEPRGSHMGVTRLWHSWCLRNS